MTKICTRCKQIKESDCFRKRSQKRKQSVYYYLNPTCKCCDAEIARANYQKNKDIQEFKEQNRARVKRYRKDNVDIVVEKDQARRQTERHKENRKIYIQNNKEKILAQERICKKKWAKKQKDLMTDYYIASVIIGKSTLARREVPYSLIKLKRLQLICKQQLKLIIP